MARGYSVVRSYLGALTTHHRSQFTSRYFASAAKFEKNDTLNTEAEIDEYLSTPTWSVKTLIPTESQIQNTTEVSSKHLHHLLKLCALPPPENAEEEEKMLRDLRSQLHFVKQIQRVDTEGVEPMQGIKVETPHAAKENEITMETLKDALAQEDLVGKHHKRIRRRTDIVNDVEDVENWDVLGQAPHTVGRYFVVESSKT